jgi:8-oxo-dGTP pyrophosphatase MutT (NUDIX family)
MNAPPFSWLTPHGPPWRAGPARPQCDNPWFRVDSFDAVAPTGAPAAYHVQHYKHVAVGVLPLHADGTVTLVGQWRFPFGTYQWEIPEGGAPHDEDPLDGARRELREEAGLAAETWREVLRMQLSNASSDEIAIGYLATRLSRVEAAPEPTEALAVARPPFREALHAAVTGWVQDSITVAMLLRVHHMAVEGELDGPLAATILAR